MSLCRDALALLVVACSAASGCGNSSAAPNDAAPARDGASPADEAVFVEGCRALPDACTSSSDPDCGLCQYRVFVGRECSAAAPCDDLLLYWSNFGCEKEELIGFAEGLLGGSPDWVIACVQPMYPGELLPSSAGAPAREEMLIGELYGRIRPGGDLAVWTGKNMLTAGCSAGASRTPVVAARTSADDSWLGTDKNAACLSDGVVNLPVQDRFVGEGVALGGMSCSGRHGRVVTAYTSAAPRPGHSCSDSPGNQCACDPAHLTRIYEGSCGDGNCLDFDSIVVESQAGELSLAPEIDPSAFAIPNWRLFTEGSAFAESAQRCEMDTVPREPFEALCAAIDADSGHRCEFQAQPDARHCAFFTSEFASICMDWFRSL